MFEVDNLTRKGKLNRDKIITYCDKTIEACIYILIFCLPFSKAIIEISATLAFFAWITKRSLSGCNTSSSKSSRIIYILSKFKPIHTELNIPLFAFILTSMVSLIHSKYIFKSFEGLFFRWLEYVMLYFVIVETINNRKRLLNVLTIMLLSAGIIGIDGIIQYFTGVDLIRRHPLVLNRVTASFGYFNTFAMYLVGIIPIYVCLILFGLRSNKLRWLMTLFTFILMVCLALTYSRGGWLALFLSLVFIGFLRDRRILIGLIIFICVSPFLLPDSIKERVAYTWKKQGDSGRLVIWRGAIRMIEDRPFFGHGLNTFMSNYPKYRTDNSKGSHLSHNCYLMIAAETGLIGFAMFMWIIFILFKRSLFVLGGLRENIKHKQSTRFIIEEAILLGLLAATVANLSHSFVDNNLQTMQTATLFWFTVGLIFAFQRVIKLNDISKESAS